MSDPMMPPDDELLAFVRGELAPEAEQQLLARTHTDAALMRRLDDLRVASGEAFADAAKASDAAAFARMQTRIAATTRPQTGNASLWRTLGDWLRSYAMPVQGALAALVLALAVTLAGTLTWGTSNRSTSPAMVRGPMESCLVVDVRFKAGVREDQVGMWLTEYNASFIDGPNTLGIYKIRLPNADALTQFIHDPQAANLAEGVQQNPGCDGSNLPSGG